MAAYLGFKEVWRNRGRFFLFSLVIALIATVNGSSAGRDPEGISEAATRTMVGAVTTILLIDLLFALWPN